MGKDRVKQNIIHGIQEDDFNTDSPVRLGH